MKAFKFKSITRKISFMGAIVSIFLIIPLTFGSIIVSQKVIEDIVYENSMKNVDSYSKVIENWLSKRKAELEMFSSNPAVIQYRNESESSIRITKEYINKEAEKKDDYYLDILIADKDGNYILSNSNSTGTVNDRDYFNSAMMGQIVISEPIYSKNLGKEVCVIAAPIRDNRGNVKGVVGYVIDLVKFYSYIEEFNVDKKYNYSYIVNKFGQIITHPNKSYIIKENISKQSRLVDKKLTESAVSILGNKKGYARYEAEIGLDFLYFSEIPGTNGWKIVSVISAKQIYHPIKELFIMLIGLGVGGITIGYILNVIVAKSISKPIIKMQKVFDKAAEGDLTVKAEVQSEDEIGRAALSFNTMMQTISIMTYFDPITETPNLNSFNDRLALEIGRRRLDKKKFGIAVISLDKFKKINDMFGHVSGDKVLRQIALRLNEIISQKDMVSRITGDEFMILFSEIDTNKDIVKITQSILEEVRKPILISDQELYITASAGIAFYPNDGITEEEIMKNASIAKSRAKDSGGDNLQLYNSSMNETLREELAIECYLYNALERKEFNLHYQPLVSVKSGKIEGAEALIRWNNIALGQVSPAKFIPIAEKTGLIIPIGEWVLREACRQNKKWQDEGLKTVVVAVNVSVYQFEKDNFVDKVIEILNEVGLDPRYLELEITEGLAMNDVEDKIKKLERLKEAGVSISIDDFGTGYSSLSYLKRLPVHSLKIDQSFVQDIVENSNSKAIISTIASMGTNLNMSVTAEGVETREQFSFIREQNCNKVQGYLFSKPVVSSEMEKYLRADIALI